MSSNLSATASRAVSRLLAFCQQFEQPAFFGQLGGKDIAEDR